MKLNDYFSHWNQLHRDLLWTVDQFSQDELTHVPFEGSWPVGEIMVHIPDAEDGWFRYVVKRELQDWPGFTLEQYPDKSSIKGLISEVHARTETFLDSLELSDLKRPVTQPWNNKEIPLGWIIWHVLEHEIHHRGELSMILGTLGREGLDV